ncbi:hypothetical protein OIV83_001650 [Microbotryomycetes sp. JL201]|nr:hypothetical protein OIV83_001650 [Microbotryomycetes sp. JL201]
MTTYSSSADDWGTPSQSPPAVASSWDNAGDNSWGDSSYTTESTTSTATLTEVVSASSPEDSWGQIDDSHVKVEHSVSSWGDAAVATDDHHTHDATQHWVHVEASIIEQQQTSTSAISTPHVRGNAKWPEPDARGRRRPLPSQYSSFMDALEARGISLDKFGRSTTNRPVDFEQDKPRRGFGGGTRGGSNADGGFSSSRGSFGGGTGSNGGYGVGGFGGLPTLPPHQQAPQDRRPSYCDTSSSYGRKNESFGHVTERGPASDDAWGGEQPAMAGGAEPQSNDSWGAPPSPVTATAGVDGWGNNAQQFDNNTTLERASSIDTEAVSGLSSWTASEDAEPAATSNGFSNSDSASNMARDSTKTRSGATTPGDRSTASSKWATASDQVAPGPAARSREQIHVETVSGWGTSAASASPTNAPSDKAPTPVVKTPTAEATSFKLDGSGEPEPAQKVIGGWGIKPAEPSKRQTKKADWAAQRSAWNKSSPLSLDPAQSTSADEWASTPVPESATNGSWQATPVTKVSSTSPPRAATPKKAVTTNGTEASEWAQPNTPTAPTAAPSSESASGWGESVQSSGLTAAEVSNWDASSAATAAPRASRKVSTVNDTDASRWASGDHSQVPSAASSVSGWGDTASTLTPESQTGSALDDPALAPPAIASTQLQASASTYVPAGGRPQERVRPPRAGSRPAQHLAKNLAEVNGPVGPMRLLFKCQLLMSFSCQIVEKKRDAVKEAQLDELMARMKLKNEIELQRQAASLFVTGRFVQSCSECVFDDAQDIDREKKEYENQVRQENEQRRLFAEKERAAKAARLAAENEKKERSARLQAALDAERAKAAEAKRKHASGREWDSFKVDRSAPEPTLRPSEQAMLMRQAREDELEAERARHGGELPKYRQDEVWDSVQHRED